MVTKLTRAAVVGNEMTTVTRRKWKTMAIIMGLVMCEAGEGKRWRKHGEGVGS